MLDYVDGFGCWWLIIFGRCFNIRCRTLIFHNLEARAIILAIDLEFSKRVSGVHLLIELNMKSGVRI